MASRLEAAGYAVTRQVFPFDFFEDLAPPVFQQVSPTPTTYQTPEQFTTMTYSGSGDVTAAARHVTQLGALGPGCTSADFAGFPTGNIALIRRGGCTFKTKAINAQTAGASAVVIYNNVDGPLNGLEIAEQLAARDYEPRNRLRFAFWGAEEFNLVGSTYYVSQLSADELDDHLLNLNFDMVGSPNYVRFVYDGDNSAFEADGSRLLRRSSGRRSDGEAGHPCPDSTGLRPSEHPCHRLRGRPPRGPLSAVLAARPALGLGPRARLRLRLAGVAVRALLAQLRRVVAAALAQRLARVARDHAADDHEQDEQRAADRVEQRPVGLLLRLDRRGRGGRRRRARGGLWQRPERAGGILLGERGGSRQREGEKGEEGGEAAHCGPHGRANPVRAQRSPAKRAPHVASRTAIRPASPAQTPTIPQPLASASSATGT